MATLSSSFADDIPVEVIEREEDPMHVYPLKIEPCETIRPRYHISNPHLYRTDHGTREELLKINNNLNWKNALFGRSCPGYYFGKFPEPIHRGGFVNYMDLVFTLPSERITHSQFYDEHAKLGRVELTITKAQLFKLIENKIDTKRRDFHIIPKHIEVVEADSTLPITLDLTLKSQLPNSAFNIWSTPHGICSYHDPTNRANKFTHVTVRPNHHGEMATSKNLVFRADDSQNLPSFSQYINLDFDNLLAQISKMKVMHEAVPVYKFICPLPDELNFSLPFWFLLNEWSEIKARTTRAFSSELKLNHLSNDGINNYILVSQKVLNEIIANRSVEYSHSTHLMNLNQVVLVITPLLGEQGWKDYRDILGARNTDLGNSNDLKYARFQCTIRIAYEQYSGAVPDADDVTSSLHLLKMKAESATSNVPGGNDKWF